MSTIAPPSEVRPVTRAGQAPAAGRQRAEAALLIATLDGRAITVAASTTAGHDRIVARRLDRPGALASAYFGDGLREVLVHGSGGTVARARIERTAFEDGERICVLALVA